MNLFNSYQALAIYTATPFAIQYFTASGNTAWAVILGLGEFAGFLLLGWAVNEATSK